MSVNFVFFFNVGRDTSSCNFSGIRRKEREYACE